VIRYKKIVQHGEGLVPNEQLVEAIKKINQAN